MLNLNSLIQSYGLAE